MYAGLGIVERSSGSKVYSKKLTRDYNRLLKYTVKQAAEAAITSKDNPFRRQYLRMTLEQGIYIASSQTNSSEKYISNIIWDVEKWRGI